MLLGDINQTFGSDIVASPTGDLGFITGTDLGTQRILRRLLTNIDGYIWHPEFGAGLKAAIGQPLSQDKLRQLESLIISNIFLEERVAKTPPPVITFQLIQDGIFCQIKYTDVPSQQNIVLSFNINQ